MKTSNAKAGIAVRQTQTFSGNNTYAEWVGTKNNSAYVVYSYGRHWPLFIKYGETWYENKDRYSVTTGRHRSQLHPCIETVKRAAWEMREIRDRVESGEVLR